MTNFESTNGRKEKLEKFVEHLRQFDEMAKDLLSTTLQELRSLQGPAQETPQHDYCDESSKSTTTTSDYGTVETSVASDVSHQSTNREKKDHRTDTGLASRDVARSVKMLPSTAREEGRDRGTITFDTFGDPSIDAMVSMNVLGGATISPSDLNAIAQYVRNSSKLSVLKVFEMRKQGGATKTSRRSRSLFLWTAATQSNLELLSGHSKATSPLQLFDRVIPAIPHLRVKGTPTVVLCCLASFDQAYKSPKGLNDWISRDSQKGFDCIKGTGRLIPDYKEAGSLRGHDIPYGKTIQNTQFPSYTLNFNEYIFHNPRQVSLQFIVVLH